MQFKSKIGVKLVCTTACLCVHMINTNRLAFSTFWNHTEGVTCLHCGLALTGRHKIPSGLKRMRPWPSYQNRLIEALPMALSKVLTHIIQCSSFRKITRWRNTLSPQMNSNMLRYSYLVGERRSIDQSIDKSIEIPDWHQPVYTWPQYFRDEKSSAKLIYLFVWITICDLAFPVNREKKSFELTWNDSIIL